MSVSEQQSDRPNFEDAIKYVDRVKAEFVSEPDVYRLFIDILQTHQRENVEVSLILARVTALFLGYPDLTREYAQFMPSDFKDDYGIDIIRRVARCLRSPEDGHVSREDIARLGMLAYLECGYVESDLGCVIWMRCSSEGVWRELADITVELERYYERKPLGHIESDIMLRQQGQGAWAEDMGLRLEKIGDCWFQIEDTERRKLF